MLQFFNCILRFNDLWYYFTKIQLLSRNPCLQNWNVIYSLLSIALRPYRAQQFGNLSKLCHFLLLPENPFPFLPTQPPRSFWFRVKQQNTVNFSRYTPNDFQLRGCTWWTNGKVKVIKKCNKMHNSDMNTLNLGVRVGMFVNKNLVFIFCTSLGLCFW